MRRKDREQFAELHTETFCLIHLVAIVEAHAAEGRQLGLQALVPRLLLLLVELLPLDLLPHAPGLLDGLHHCILVGKQRRGVEAGQNVCDGTEAHQLHVSRDLCSLKNSWNLNIAKVETRSCYSDVKTSAFNLCFFLLYCCFLIQTSLVYVL